MAPELMEYDFAAEPDFAAAYRAQLGLSGRDSAWPPPRSDARAVIP